MAERGVAPLPAPAEAAPYRHPGDRRLPPSRSRRPPAGSAEIVAEPPAHAIEGARAQAVLAFADELVADPSLLAAWSAAFDGSDDVTLVIYAPAGRGARGRAPRAPVVAQAGLDGEDAADLIALATPATVALEASLAAGASAVLTARALRPPFAALARVDAATVAHARAGRPLAPEHRARAPQSE